MDSLHYDEVKEDIERIFLLRKDEYFAEMFLGGYLSACVKFDILTQEERERFEAIYRIGKGKSS